MRLTKRDGVMVWFTSQNHKELWLEPCEMSYHDNRIVIDRLAEYEDAEEQGRLVMLPEKLYGLYEWDVTGVRYYNGKVTAYYVKNEQVESIIYESEIGKSVFLTREKAEAVLKGESKDV